MDRRLPVRVIAGCLAMAAFAVAIVSGLATGVAADEILVRALGALVICYIVGTGVGVAADVAVRENLNAFERAHPFSPNTAKSSNQSSQPAVAAKAGAVS